MNRTGRILALDYGTKRIGLALSDDLQIIAQPYKTLTRSSLEADLLQIQTILTQENVMEIVMGLPKREDGSLGPMAQEAKSFANRIRKQMGLPVRMWDERYSSHAAQRALLEGNVRRAKRKTIIDQTAAVWILQGYLDSKTSL